jgi:hypothetical protein
VDEHRGEAAGDGGEGGLGVHDFGGVFVGGRGFFTEMAFEANVRWALSWGGMGVGMGPQIQSPRRAETPHLTAAQTRCTSSSSSRACKSSSTSCRCMEIRVVRMCLPPETNA